MARITKVFGRMSPAAWSSSRRGSQAAGTPSWRQLPVFVQRLPGAERRRPDRVSRVLTGTEWMRRTNRHLVRGSGELALVARTGSQAPGTESGVNFIDLHFPSLNSSGQIAFRANLTGSGVDSSNDKGIWATDRPARCSSSSAPASSWKSRPANSARSATWISFHSGNSDGRSSGFNNLGQLVFWARFTDGSQGVFVSNAVAHLPGDFNNDGTVDAADYVVWRKNDGTQTGYDAWRANFGDLVDVGNGSAATGSPVLAPNHCQPPFRNRPASPLPPLLSAFISSGEWTQRYRRLQKSHHAGRGHRMKSIITTNHSARVRSSFSASNRRI